MTTERPPHFNALMLDTFPRWMIEFAMGAGAASDLQFHSVLNRDGTDHSRLRRLIGRASALPLVVRASAT